MVRQEADLTLVLNLAAFIEFVRMKVKRISERFAPKERNKTCPGWLWFCQVTEELTVVVEAWSSYCALVS